jgi:hypothetical protein
MTISPVGVAAAASEGAAVRVSFPDGRSAVLRYDVETPRGRVAPRAVAVEGARVRASLPMGTVTDNLALAPDGGLDVVRRWDLRPRGPVRCLFTVEAGGAYPRWVVPAVMYDGNAEGRGRFPRGGLEVGWSFREDRCPIPSCAVVAGDSGSWALFTQPAPDEARLSSIRSSAAPGGAALEVGVPWIEGPRSYREKGWPIGGQHGPRGRWFAAGPLASERRFTLLPGAGPRIPYQALFTAARARSAPPGGALWAGADWGRYIALKAHWLRTFGLYRKGGVTGIIRGPRMAPVLQQLFGDYVGGSFLSKGMEAAACLQRLAAETGDPGPAEEARAIADFLLAGELPAGLAFDDYSIHARRFGGFFFPGRRLSRAASTRCMGESAQQYVRLHELAGPAADPRWLDHARRVAGFLASRQLPDGNLGRFWSPDGALLDARGTNGAYGIWLMAELARATGDRSWLGPARRAADFFIRTAVAPQRFTFDTLDAECVDKEAGHALLRAFLLLHRLTGERDLLEAARESAAYCLGWQYCWDVPFSPSTPLAALGFHTLGGTAVSVAHHHLDAYGMAIALDFLRLSSTLAEPCWAEWAHDLMGFCSQAVSTPERPLSLGADYVGWQPEQFNQTDWDYLHHLVGGKGRYSSDAAWVASLTLGAALDIRSEFPGHLPNAEHIPAHREARP